MTHRQRQRFAILTRILRAQLEAAIESDIFERTAGHWIGMVLERVFAVELHIQSSREEGAANIGSRSQLPHLGQSGEEYFVNRIIGLRLGLALELFLKLVDRQIQLRSAPVIG